MAEIFSVTPDDINELSLFLSNFQRLTRKQEFWLDRFTFWWDRNPAFSDKGERGWILREKGVIVGFLGIIPTSFQLRSKKITALNATTWEVLPKYRNESIRLLFKQINFSKNTILFNTTPTGEVVKILKSLKFQSFSGVNNTPGRRKTSLIILNFENVLKSKLGINSFFRLIIKLWIPILRIFNLLYLRKLNKTELTNVRQVMKADILFDQLWERTKNMYQNTNIRTADIINWYCFGMQDNKKEIFGYYKNNQLLGYIICTNYKPKNLRIFECLDFWFDPAEIHIVGSLINFTLKYARDNSIDLIIFPHFTSELGRYIRGLGLLAVKAPLQEKFFKVNANMLDSINETNSYLVSLQGDYLLS